MTSRITLDPTCTESLPRPFLAWCAEHLTGTRAIYLHWSGGLYGRAVGTHHKQVAVPTPVALDESIQKYADARQRRIGGAYQALYHTVESYKKQAVLQIFTNAPYAHDLEGHTPHRDTNSISLALMCGLGSRPNDVGYAPPLPLQLKALTTLVAEACLAVHSPVTACLTAAEAADNLDFAAPDDADAPHAPFGFGSTRACIELALWIDPATLEVFAPLQSARPGWKPLGDWVREEALTEICRRTREQWDRADTQPAGSSV
jgi:hypothetical protein